MSPEKKGETKTNRKERKVRVEHSRERRLPPKKGKEKDKGRAEVEKRNPYVSLIKKGLLLEGVRNFELLRGRGGGKMGRRGEKKRRLEPLERC